MSTNFKPLNTVMIGVGSLIKSDSNARKSYSKAGIAELKASIMAHGLLQNLVVVSAAIGAYEVIAGGRRLAALLELAKESKITLEYEVPCTIRQREDAGELTIVENLIREEMHPADEFEAFSKLIEGGADIDLVARRFGKEPKYVAQRMRLGRVAPELLKYYREGKIDLEALMAFAITEDKKEQMRVWKSLGQWEKNTAWAIKKKLTEKVLKHNDSRVLFVGIDAYQAAGGLIRPDLFSDDQYLEDSKLLEKLFTEKLNARLEKLKKEGWGFVEYAEEYKYEFTAKYDRLSKKPESKDELAKCGVYVHIGRDGKLDVTMLKPEKGKKLIVKKDNKHYSQALIDTLKRERQTLIQVALVTRHELALTVLIFKPLMRLIANDHIFEGANVDFKDESHNNVGLDNAQNVMQTDWADKKDEIGSFERLWALPLKEKLDLLALVTAHAMPPSLQRSDRLNFLDKALSLSGVDVAKLWRPSSEFLKRLTAAQIVEIGKTLYGTKWEPKSFNKSWLVTQFTEIFANPAKAAAGDMDLQSKIENWLPEGMTFEIPAVAPKKAIKKRKAA